MKHSPATILIVEDEVMLQDVYKLVLETKGHTVFIANNGAEALEKIAEIDPDVVLLDMLMPVMDGTQFMRTISLSDHPNTKVIAYSNLSDSAVEAEILELGASRFVLKSSMTPTDLVTMIETL